MQAVHICTFLPTLTHHPFFCLFCFWGQHTTKVDISHLKHFPIDKTSNSSTINTLIRCNKGWFPLFTFVTFHHCFWKQSILQIRLGWFEGLLCVLGGTSTPSGQRFDRWAIITVLNLVTEYIWMPTHHSWRGREGSINGNSTEFKGTVWDWKTCACKLWDVQYEGLFFLFCFCFLFCKYDKIEGTF